MIENFLTRREICAALKISQRTFERLAQSGQLPCFKVGGSWRMTESEFQSWQKSLPRRKQKFRKMRMVER